MKYVNVNEVASRMEEVVCNLLIKGAKSVIYHRRINNEEHEYKKAATIARSMNGGR